MSMDERLQKALEFSNYNLTITNQKQNIKNRVKQLQVVHHAGGVFTADQSTIAFVKTFIDLGHTDGIIIDSKENPIVVSKLQDFLEKLMTAYISSVQEYDAEYSKLRKARNIKQIMDW
jgi:hypothetical protein